MPPTSWARERARNRQPHLRRLVMGEATPCQACGHVRSSHSMLVLTGRCKAQGCPCDQFEPMCGCGHLLISHQWGTVEAPWACYQCACRHFGPVQDVVAVAEQWDGRPFTLAAPPAGTVTSYVAGVARA